MVVTRLLVEKLVVERTLVSLNATVERTVLDEKVVAMSRTLVS